MDQSDIALRLGFPRRDPCSSVDEQPHSYPHDAYTAAASPKEGTDEETYMENRHSEQKDIKMPSALLDVNFSPLPMRRRAYAQAVSPSGIKESMTETRNSPNWPPKPAYAPAPPQSSPNTTQ